MALQHASQAIQVRRLWFPPRAPFLSGAARIRAPVSFGPLQNILHQPDGSQNYQGH